MNNIALDIDALERLARAATAGPWVTDERHPGKVYSDDATGSMVADFGPFTFVARDRKQCTANAAFASALDPQTVLALIQMVRTEYSRTLRYVKEGMQVAQAAGVRPDCGWGCQPGLPAPGCVVHDPTAPISAAGRVTMGSGA